MKLKRAKHRPPWTTRARNKQAELDAAVDAYLLQKGQEVEVLMLLRSGELSASEVADIALNLGLTQERLDKL